jgi:hypothetical protein
MKLLILSSLALLVTVGTAVAILGKKTSRLHIVSEAWKLFFAFILYWVGDCLNPQQDSSLAAAHYGMTLFAYLLLAWFVVSILHRPKSAKP